MQRVKKQAAQYLDKQRKHKRFTKVVTVLAGAVVFCTTYALILPAITMTTPLDCELTEHTHTEECYMTEMVTPEPQIVCGLEEEEAHTHDESCYGESTVVCGLEEQDAHTHDENCYIDGELVCETDETEGHVHIEDCFVTATEPLCGKTETEGHTHTDDCVVVGEPEAKTTLVCEQVEHVHDDSCYLALELDNNIYYCGFDTEHIHDDSGYFEDGELKCTIVEHVHTEECLIKPVVIPDPIALDDSFTAESEDGAVVVELYVRGEAILPDDAEISADATPELTVTESEDMEIYDEYAELAAEEGEVMMVAALEYALVIDGYELDISGCEVEISVTPTEEFREMLNAPQEIALMTAAADDETDDDEVIEEAYYFSYFSETVGRVGYAVTSGANPTFTVQYYAWLDRAVKTDYGKTLTDWNTYKNFVAKGNLPVINTEGGKLPENGKNYGTPNGNNISYLKVENGRIKTERKLTEIYKAESLEYQKAPGLKYFNIVLKNSDTQYELTQIWVLKDGKSADSTNEKDWEVYDYKTTTRFTNRPETVDADAEGNFILINDSATIRLVYDTKSVDENLPANFYDYNVTDGRLYQKSDMSGKPYWLGRELFAGALQSSWEHLYMKTWQIGINSSTNYTGKSGAKLAFGNGGISMGWENEKWTDSNGITNTLNVANKEGKSFLFCTFGLAPSAEKVIVKDDEGNDKTEYHIKYASGVAAPNLFNDGDAKGKDTYKAKAGDKYSLNFKRVGDTYTLSSVEGTNAQNLTNFNNPTCGSTTYTHILTNNFWPMDGASNDYTDSQFGASEDSARIQNSGGNMPLSDDGQYHNSFFGMQFAVTFDLTRNYVGPLEYFFFGDDDMWVYLDDTLVCDIGGVHSSVGEYVNLWNYIKQSDLDALGEDETKTYTLTFYYTERGASGSTCWMQFTLPTVVGLDLASELEKEVDAENGSLWIEKRLSGVENTDWFYFKLKLEGVETYDNFVVQNANGEVVRQGDGVKEYITGNDIFQLRAGDVLVIQKLPKDTKYTITEVKDKDGTPLAGYHTETETFLYSAEKESETGEFEKTVTQGTTAEGDITVSDITKVIFTNTSSYELPATGGSGTTLWYATGALLLIAAALLMYKKRQWLFGEEGRA